VSTANNGARRPPQPRAFVWSTSRISGLGELGESGAQDLAQLAVGDVVATKRQRFSSAAKGVVTFTLAPSGRITRAIHGKNRAESGRQ
jgi:hypothetical protein